MSWHETDNTWLSSGEIYKMLFAKSDTHAYPYAKNNIQL